MGCTVDITISFILQSQEVMLSIYGFLERLAIAFEQIVKDNADDNTTYNTTIRDGLREARCHLKEVSTMSLLRLG